MKAALVHVHGCILRRKKFACTFTPGIYKKGNTQHFSQDIACLLGHTSIRLTGNKTPKHCRQLPTLHNNHLNMADNEAVTLFRDLFAWRMAESPEFATFCGIHDRDDLLDDLSEEAYIRRENAVKGFLKRAMEIDDSKCMKQQMSLLLLRDQLEEYLRGTPFKWTSMFYKRKLCSQQLLLSHQLYGGRARGPGSVGAVHEVQHFGKL